MKRREFLIGTFAGGILTVLPSKAVGNPFLVEGRVYDVDVLNLDGNPDKDGDVFDHSTTLIYQDHLPVYLENGKGLSVDSLLTMASMSLYRRGRDQDYARTLAAYMNFNTAPDDVRQVLPRLFPSVAGSVLRREGRLIKKAEITRIMLTTAPNSDPRIRRLGEKT